MKAAAWLIAHAKHTGADCLPWPFAHARRKDGGPGYPIARWRGRCRKVGRIMCELAHGPPPDPALEAAHSCGRGMGPDACIHPEHLRWATPAENNHDKLAHGTDSGGERNNKAKLTQFAVAEIRKNHAIISTRALAARFGVSRAAIADVISGRTWKRSPSPERKNDANSEDQRHQPRPMACPAQG